MATQRLFATFTTTQAKERIVGFRGVTSLSPDPRWDA